MEAINSSIKKLKAFSLSFHKNKSEYMAISFDIYFLFWYNLYGQNQI